MTQIEKAIGRHKKFDLFGAACYCKHLNNNSLVINTESLPEYFSYQGRIVRMLFSSLAPTPYEIQRALFLLLRDVEPLFLEIFLDCFEKGRSPKDKLEDIKKCFDDAKEKNLTILFKRYNASFTETDIKNLLLEIQDDKNSDKIKDIIKETRPNQAT
jgi:hypothetical protein